MLSRFVLAALAAVSFVSAASNNTICNTSLYASVACLTGDPGASSVCAEAPKQTLTVTVTTTTLEVNSVVITQSAKSQITVQSTETELTTKTVTSGPVTIITAKETKVITSNTTLSTYVPTETAGAGLFPPLCVPSNAVSALGSLGNDTLATACSCLGYPIPRTTSTRTITAKPVQVTSTFVEGSPKTTTIFHLVRKTTTLTVRPAKTTTKHVTSCTTATIYETYAAPTFTKVYGPKAGCADVAPGEPKKLDSSITQLHNATAECKGICEQDSECSFVYVQRLFEESSGKPYFGCVLNAEQFDEENTLECGKKAGVYGVAVGFDAVDRGTEVLG